MVTSSLSWHLGRKGFLSWIQGFWQIRSGNKSQGGQGYLWGLNDGKDGAVPPEMRRATGEQTGGGGRGETRSTVWDMLR